MKGDDVKLFLKHFPSFAFLIIQIFVSYKEVFDTAGELFLELFGIVL